MSNAKLGLPLLPSWLRWAGVALLAVAIFYFSVLSAPPGDPVVEPPSIVPLDKWRHFLAYAALGGAMAYATVDWERRTRTIAVASLVVLVCYGIGLEVWQSFLPERYFGLGDAYANALGGVLAMPLFWIRERVPFATPGELLAAVRG